MSRYLAAFALFAVALAAPRDRRQVFLSPAGTVLAPPAAAPAIVGAQQTPGGHVTGASASIKIHASPAIQTPVIAAPTVLAAAPAPIFQAIGADGRLPHGVPLQQQPDFIPTAPLLLPARI